MSPRNRRRRHRGCYVDVTPGGKLRFRFRAHLPGFGRYRFGESTELEDTDENRRLLERQADLIGAEITAGRFDYVRWFPFGTKAACFQPQATAANVTRVAHQPSASPTVAEYFDSWIVWKESERVRRSRLCDYRRHFKKWITPILGSLKLGDLSLLHLRDLQMQLRQRGLAEKTVRNVMLGSLKALVRDARRDGLDVAWPFAELEWIDPIVDDPDPFTEDERDRLLEYFRTKAWKVDGFDKKRHHYAYYAFLFTLFFTGCRPSELTALRVGDLDLGRGTLRVRRSRHLGAEAAPKTRSAARLVRLVPANVVVLEPLWKLDARVEDYVFQNVRGEPIDQSNFAELFRRAQRALGIGPRKFYATKHTYVSIALTRGVNLAWLSEQTGVAATTLLKHYGKFMHTLDADRVELSKIEGGTVPIGPRLAHGSEGEEDFPRKQKASGMSPRGFEPLLPA